MVQYTPDAGIERNKWCENRRYTQRRPVSVHKYLERRFRINNSHYQYQKHGHKVARNVEISELGDDPYENYS